MRKNDAAGTPSAPITPPIAVYRIDIGGSIYVGQTTQGTTRRIYQHRHSPVNRRLGDLLQSGADHNVTIIGRALSRADATRKEAAAINRLRAEGKDVLNRFTPGREAAELSQWRVAQRPPRDWAPCSLCRRRLDKTMFNRDRSRSSGLGSRCRDCSALLQLLTQRGHTRKQKTEQYYAARKMVKAWVEAGYRGPHPNTTTERQRGRKPFVHSCPLTAECVRLYRSGLAVKQVAAAAGITASKAKYRLAISGEPMRRKGPR